MTQQYSLQRAAFAPTRLAFMGEAVGTVAEWFFSHPARDVVGTQMRQDHGDWREPLRELSLASWPEGEAPLVPSSDGEQSIRLDNGDCIQARQAHNVLVAASFYLHPMFGLGHLVLTDGRTGAFWDGAETHVVHVTNLQPCRVVLSRTTTRSGAGARPKRANAVDLAMEMLGL